MKTLAIILTTIYILVTCIKIYNFRTKESYMDYMYRQSEVFQDKSNTYYYITTGFEFVLNIVLSILLIYFCSIL